MKEAMFWESTEGDKVQCGLCYHRCIIANGKTGVCGVRENKGGVLFSLVYGKAVSHAVDPIEKKPLYHFLPGSESFSIATVGCNFRCLHCQNYNISHPPDTHFFSPGNETPPAQIVKLAKRQKCQSISYTYTEPTVFFEFAHDTAKLATSEGIKNVFVTNGYISPEPLKEINPYLHAANIDLKFFREETYSKICGSRLAPVLDTIKLYHSLGIWIELTTLVIPGYNDSDEELGDIASFIAGIDKQIPWHVTRFHPTHKMLDRPATPVATLERARKIGLEAGLQHVYVGNVISSEDLGTYCPSCGTLVIERAGFGALLKNCEDGACTKCGSKIAGVWN